MAKSTNTPSKTTARTTGRSTAKKTAAPKRTASSRTTSSSTTKNKEEQKTPQRASRTTTAKKPTPARKTTPNRSTSAAPKRASEQKSAPTRPAPTAAKKASEQKTVQSPPKQNKSTNPSTDSRATGQRPVQQPPQKRTESSPPPSRYSNNANSNMRAQSPSARPMPLRPEQRTQQKPQPGQWQQQNRNAPSQSAQQPIKQEPKSEPPPTEINIKLDQSVAILIDGNNIEMSLHSVSKSTASMINFDKLIPTLLGNRALSRLIYFREGKSISPKLAERLQKMFHGSVVPCHKSADIPLSIKAVQVASKVDTIIILSGDADYVELVRHLKHDGIRVEIAAFPETTADILRQESDYFFPITVEYSFALK